MTSDVDSLERLRDELQDQLAIATAAKTSEESQGALIDYVQNEAEPAVGGPPWCVSRCFVPCVLSTRTDFSRLPQVEGAQSSERKRGAI